MRGPGDPRPPRALDEAPLSLDELCKLWAPAWADYWEREAEKFDRWLLRQYEENNMSGELNHEGLRRQYAVGLRSDRDGSAPAPSKRSEIPEALQYLDDQLGKAHEISKLLEQRLCSVLRAATPENGKTGTAFIAGTPHGQGLRECASCAGQISATLSDILDRLEL